LQSIFFHKKKAAHASGRKVFMPSFSQYSAVTGSAGSFPANIFNRQFALSSLRARGNRLADFSKKLCTFLAGQLEK
jgi:hypothetical protein